MTLHEWYRKTPPEDDDLIELYTEHFSFSGKFKVMKAVLDLPDETIKTIDFDTHYQFIETREGSEKK